MLAKKVRDLGLDRLGQQSTRPIAQDFGELIVDVSWLNQLDDVIFGHGISLLRWRSGGVKHPHDMPPFRFPPSPTFSDSSLRTLPALLSAVQIFSHSSAETASAQCPSRSGVMATSRKNHRVQRTIQTNR